MYSNSYKNYVLVLLTIVYTLSFMDRFIVGLFMQPIKEEFLLSDTQLGFLTGIAFALFYATMGIPIARWADRGNRVTITSLAIAMWGGAVMLCGMVTSFAQLVLVRIGSAVGEAGVMPPAYSLIADYFPVKERAKAVSIYMMAIPVSILISFLFAGWIGEIYGWRVAFLLTGIPGAVIAILVYFSVNEPRIMVSPSEKVTNNTVSFVSVIKNLWNKKSFRYLLVGVTLVNFVSIGVSQWSATFFIRRHQMAIGDLGLWLGLISGIGGMVGTYLGGYIAGRYFSDHPSLQIRLASFIPVIVFTLTVSMLLTPDKHIALLIMVPINVIGWLSAGPMTAIILQLVEDRMRATAMAILSFTLNLVGMGLGPQAVGMLSDFFIPYFGANSLQVAMIVGSMAGFGTSYYYWIAARSVKSDIQEIEVLKPLEGAENRKKIALST